MNDPYANVLDIQRQTWENAADVLEKLERVDEANRTVANVEVGGTPREVVYEENKLELLHYEPRTDEQFDVPILFVYALFNKPFILDLQPDRSVVRTFLDHGFDVYMIDWNEPSLMDHALTFEDYVDRYIDDCVNVVRERSGQDAIDFFGYCMGGTMSLLYAALYPERVRNLGLMAASVCLKGRDGVLDQWIGDDSFDLEVLTDTFGNAPAEFLDAGFSMRDPVQNNLTKYIQFFDGIEDEEFVENFARMERWIDESIDIPGRMFVDFVDAVYHEQTRSSRATTSPSSRPTPGTWGSPSPGAPTPNCGPRSASGTRSGRGTRTPTPATGSWTSGSNPPPRPGRTTI